MQAIESQFKGFSEMTSGKKWLYIVDDDESICRALKLLMMTYGFLVQTFSSAEKFFNTISNSDPGCLIIDIHMPGLSGLGAQRKLKQLGSTRPVIIITADKDNSVREQAFREGAAGFFQKPFNDMELVNSINSCCR